MLRGDPTDDSTCPVSRVLGSSNFSDAHGPAELSVWDSDFAVREHVGEPEVAARIRQLVNYIKESVQMKKWNICRRFASRSLWGKFGGLHVCGATFAYMVPLPNIFLTRLFSKTRLKRKDFREILRLPWAQEAPGSNPGAPTTSSYNASAIRISFRSRSCSPSLSTSIS